MHALYKTVPNWDGIAVAQDLAKLLTNDLNIANYSTSCDKASTQIIANTAANNWTMYDANVGTGSYMLSSVEANGVAVKYLRITGTISAITFSHYLSWNPVTHTGVMASGPTSSFEGLTTNSAPTSVVVWQASTYIVMQAGNSGAWYRPNIVAGEVDRNSTFTDYYSTATNSAMVMCMRNYNGYGSGNSTDYNYGYTWTYGYNSGSSVWNTSYMYVNVITIQGPSGGYYNSQCAVNPIRNIDNTTNGLLVIPTYLATWMSYIDGVQFLGTLKDILTIHPPVVNVSNLDEVIINSINYCIVYETAVGAFAGQRTAFLVPKQ